MTMSADGLPPTLDALLAETRWIHALAHSLVVDPGTADDVAQDATVIALTKPPRDAGAVRSWLRRVVRNLALNARRGEVRREGREQIASIAEPVDAADEVVARWEIRRRVVEAVLALDEPYRATILLRFFDGMTAAGAAARLGVPLETVRTRTRRGLDLLRGRLASLDDGRGRRGAAVLLLLARRETDVAAPLTAPSGAAAGGVVMAGGAKWALGAALVALLGLGAAWVASNGGGAPPPARDVASGTTAAAVARPHRAAEVETGASDARAGVDLDACDRERDLFGVVVDPDGKPVGGAAVTALRRKPLGSLVRRFGAWDPYRTAEATTSARDGTFALRLGKDDGVALRVDAPGFALWDSRDHQAGERVTVRLARALTLEVHVRSRAGSPVAGACVLASPTGGAVNRAARTDATGAVSFARLPRLTKTYLTVAPDDAPGASTSVDLGDAESQTVEVTLEAGRTVRGVVVDAVTGVPIGGAHVSYGAGFGDAARTDAAGRFEVSGVSQATGMLVYAAADGYAQDFADARRDDEVRIVLGPAVRVTGRVVDADRRPVPVADVSLFATWMDRVEHTSHGVATTPADGTFAVDGLAAGRSHRLRVDAAGFAQCWRDVAAPDKAPYVVDLGDLVLGAAHALRGKVVDAGGAPQARVQVDLRRSVAVDPFNASWQSRQTDDLGRFAFPGLAAGDYRIEASSRNGRESADVVVPESGDPAPLTIRLGAADEAKRKIPVAVRVTDDEGNPLAGVRVQVGYAANGASPSTATGADGAIAFASEFEPATVSVYLTPQQEKTHLRVFQWLRPGARDLSVVVRRGRTISGRLLYENDRPVKQGGVAAWVGATCVGWGSSDDQGNFAFAVPPGANVDLEASPQDLPRELSRSAGELRGVEPGADGLVVRVVREPATRAIDVEVVDDAGTPVAGAQISTEFRGNDWQRPVLSATGPDGRCRLETLPRAPVVMSATIHDRAAGPNRYWSPQTVRVASNIDSVRIVVRRPRVVRGRVAGEDGAPVADAIVHASPGGSRNGSMNVAGPDGRFELLVPADAPVPFPVYGNPFPPDMSKPVAGYDLVDAEDRELAIVVHPVPKR